MRKPHKEQGQSRKVQAEAPAPEPGDGSAGPWSAWPWSGWNGGLQFFEAWLQAWQSFAGSESRGARYDDSADGADDRRRVPAASWLPRVEATVIPLRRQTDPPGAEATRISMHFMVPPMPWSGLGGNVISVDALLARRTANDAERSVTNRPAPAPPPEKDES